MAEFPALPLWTDSWRADTAHLTRVERGIYMDLLIEMWRTPECRVPHDLAWIVRKLTCHEAEITMLKNIILEFCVTSGNWVWQKRLKTEFEYLRKRRGIQSDRAKARWDKEKGVCHGNASPHESGNASPHESGNASSGNALSTPTPTPSKREKEEPTVLPKRQMGTRIQIPFSPDPSCHALAERLLLSIPESQMALENFEDYWAGIPGARGCKLDWQATFRNWLRQFSQRKPHNGKTPGNRPGSMADGWDKVDAVIAEARRRENGGGEIVGEENPVELPGLRQGAG